MESIQSDYDASKNLMDINQAFSFSNASDVNMPVITDASGLTDIEERISEKVDIFNIYQSREANIQNRLMERYVPEIAIDSVFSSNLSLKFSEKVEDLMNNNSMFRKLIANIEMGLNQFIEISNIEMESSIFFEEDWEIPDYEKIILFINFKGISFNEELSLWKLISNIIYNRIKSLIHISSEGDSRKIKDLKKKFFIKLNM